MTYPAAFLCVMSVVLCGCGTAKTLFSYDETISRSLRKEKTYCETLPRLYSGVAYDFCVLNGPPNTTSGVPSGFISLFIGDFFLSAVVDTLVLPYTAYRQVRYGNVDLRLR